MPFVSWLVNQLLNRPSYMGRLERRLRGWNTEPLNLQQFEWYLLLAGSRALLEILRARDYKARRRVVELGLRKEFEMRPVEPGSEFSLRVTDPDVPFDGARGDAMDAVEYMERIV